MHKYIKCILFFLSILLLKFSFGSNLVGSNSFESFNLDFEFSEQLNPDFSEPGFTENNIFESSFLDVVSCQSKSICDGNAELVESWKKVMNAAENGAPILRKDIDILNSLSKFDDNLINKIGSDKFDNFLKKLIEANPNCKTCGSRGDALVGNMNDVLDDLRNVVISQGKALKADGSFVDGFAEFMTEAGEQASKAKAAALTLKKMSNNWYELSNGGWELYRFEGSIPDIETGHKLDALLRRTNPETGLYEYKSLEMKNWSSARSMPANKGSQFYAYIESGHKFEYYFPDGISDAMKSNFQNVFKDATKAQELWDVNPSFFMDLSDDIQSVEDLIELANDGDLIDLINWVK